MHETDKVTPEGTHKVRSWVYACREVAELERKLADAKNRLGSAEKDLGRWLMPADARANESFNVWFGDSLIQCTGGIFGRDTPSILVRTRGTALDKL